MHHHRIRVALFAALAPLALAACDDNPLAAPTVAAAPIGRPLARVGNGFPQGAADYHLNIIGVPKDKSVPLDNNNGARIFVQLYSSNTVTSPGGKNNQLAKSGTGDQNHIFLCNSTDGVNDVVDPRCDAWRATHAVNAYGVVDANGTDGDGAILALPDPCPNDNLALTPCDPTYHIYARGHGGSGGGSATITTCAEEALLIDPTLNPTTDTWCGSNGITVYVSKKASDISSALLHMTITVDGTQDPALAQCLGASTTGSTTLNISLFDDCFQNYFWNYDNNGLKNLEVRFYKAG